MMQKPYYALILLVAAASVATTGIEARQAARPAPAKAPAAPVAGGIAADKATATVQEIMAGMIDPASKAVFSAVSSEETPKGVVEKAPKNDAEWAAVRRNAVAMVEGANLLLVPGRRFAVPANMQKHNEGELSPAEIEVRVSKDRATWNNLATAFRDAATGAVKAAEAKRKHDFNAVSEAIDTACENCHLRYWYPDQEEVLKNAPKPK
jgi:hypothetical protein